VIFQVITHTSWNLGRIFKCIMSIVSKILYSSGIYYSVQMETHTFLDIRVGYMKFFFAFMWRTRFWNLSKHFRYTLYFEFSTVKPQHPLTHSATWETLLYGYKYQLSHTACRREIHPVATSTGSTNNSYRSTVAVTCRERWRLTSNGTNYKGHFYRNALIVTL
jgi:hypothetical protein